MAYQYRGPVHRHRAGSAHCSVYRHLAHHYGAPDVAALAQQTAASISARHIIMASQPDVTALAQRTAAYISEGHIILSSLPDEAVQAQHTAANGDS